MNSNAGNAFVQTSKQDKLFSAANDAIFLHDFQEIILGEEDSNDDRLDDMLTYALFGSAVWSLKGLKSLDDKTITGIQVGEKLSKVALDKTIVAVLFVNTIKHIEKGNYDKAISKFF